MSEGVIEIQWLSSYVYYQSVDQLLLSVPSPQPQQLHRSSWLAVAVVVVGGGGGDRILIYADKVRIEMSGDRLSIA